MPTLTTPYTSAQCQTVISAILAALTQPGISEITDPTGVRIAYRSVSELTAALDRWTALYNAAVLSEQGRQAIAIERRRPV